MSDRTTRTKSPLLEAWSALSLVDSPIRENERFGGYEVDDALLYGFDAMASALVALKNLDLAGAPLDEVLAAFGASDALVDTAARLIEMVSDVEYQGGALSSKDGPAAEQLREQLYEELNALLSEIEEREEKRSG